MAQQLIKTRLAIQISALFFMLASAASGNEGGGHEAAAKKPDGHAKPAAEHGGGEHGGEPAPPPAPTGPKRDYNPGKVVAFPSFTAQVIGSQKTVEFKPRKGHAAMIIFVASWCEPCQVLMADFKQLARKHAGKSTDVYFVFAHDTKEDAAAFMKEHVIPQTSVMANVDLLTAFKNPELPSVYIADKCGYLGDRFLKVKKNDIDEIDVMMGKINSL